MSLRFVRKGGTVVMAVAVFFVGSHRAAAQYNGGIAYGLASPACLGCMGGNALNNQGLGLGLGLGGGGGLGGLGGGGPGGILGNLANGLPGQGGNTPPGGRFYMYDAVTGSGRLRGSLPIVTQFAGIAGIRNRGSGMGGMGGMMGGMGSRNPYRGGNFGGGPYNGGGSNQLHNFALLPPGVQLNVGYNTLFGLPMTQAPQMNGMGTGMGNGLGMRMGNRGMGFGMNPMMFNMGGGKMTMSMGNGGYGL